ncbi:MAG: IS66 family transposase, partial [Malacoplasma sp.]
MAKIKDLEKENKALKSQLETKKNQIKELEKLNQYYIEQLKLNRQKKFGASSEKTAYDDYEQLSMFNEAESNREPLLKEPEAEEIITVKRKKSNRKKTLENLPVETIEYILEDTTCPKCKNELHVMTKEIRKELIVIPAQIKVLEHITNIYSCRNCEKTDISATIIAAESPKALIPKSMVSPSLMAEIMYRKYALSLPLDRQEKDYKRLGVNLSKQNLSNWIIKGANLLKPLCTELKNQLLKNEVLHADETTLKVLKEPGRDAELNSYMWIYRTSGDAKNHVVLYDYQVGRSGKFAKEYLKDFKGYLHTDGWAGYHQLEPQIVLCGCWAHARRKFDEAAKIYPKEDRAATKEQKMINLI